MKERPILFSGPMVRPILNMRLGVWPPEAIDPGKPIKWNTRRVCKDQTPVKYWYGKSLPMIPDGKEKYTGWVKDIKNVAIGIPSKCPYGAPGDRLWVRETHYRYGVWCKNGFTRTGKRRWKFKFYTQEVRCFDNPPDKILTIKGDKVGWYKRPSIFMPRWASRINLEITDIRVERVQDISYADCLAEGMPPVPCLDDPALTEKQITDICVDATFRPLWESINGKRGYPWAKNDWVWVVEFKRVEG